MECLTSLGQGLKNHPDKESLTIAGIRSLNLVGQVLQTVQSDYPERSNIIHCENLKQTKSIIAKRCNVGRMGYITGGFQLGLQHLWSLSFFKGPIILGLESDEYIKKKGSPVLFDLEQRIQYWKYLLPPYSLIFSVPDNTSSKDYEKSYTLLSKQIGVFKNPQIIFLGNSDLKNRLKKIVYKNNLIIIPEVNFGEAFASHTSDMIK